MIILWTINGITDYTNELYQLKTSKKIFRRRQSEEIFTTLNPVTPMSVQDKILLKTSVQFQADKWKVMRMKKNTNKRIIS